MEPGRLWLVDDEVSSASSSHPNIAVVGAVAGEQQQDGLPPVTEDVPLPSPGRALQQAREQRGMTLEDVSFATKIPRASVEQLEADRYDGLPGPVFVKGFLRSCARALDINPESVLDLFYERERELTRSRRREPSPAIPAKSVRLGTRRPSHALVEDEGEPVDPKGWAQWWQAVQARIPALSMLLWLSLIVLMAALVVIAFGLTRGLATGAV